MAQPRDIIAICQSLIPQYPNDCSGFVKAVASQCGVLISSGNANDIVEFLADNGRFLANGASAREAASRGEFVIGGLAASGHGHVVVVVKDPSGDNIYPYAFWGQYRGRRLMGKVYNFGFTRGHGHLNYAFKKDVLDQVTYRSFQPVGMLTPQAGANQGYLLSNSK